MRWILVSSAHIGPANGHSPPLNLNLLLPTLSFSCRMLSKVERGVSACWPAGDPDSHHNHRQRRTVPQFAARTHSNRECVRRVMRATREAAGGGGWGWRWGNAPGK